MDFYQLIGNRRSIRSYDRSKPVPMPVLMRIIEAGRLAPTAANRQPARMILVTNPETLSAIAACYKREWFSTAPAVLIVLGKREDAWKRQRDGLNSLEIDCAIMMDHMILAAESEGVSSCWILAFEDDPLRKVLPISEDEFICCLTPLGYPASGFAKPTMPPRKRLDDMVTII